MKRLFALLVLGVVVFAWMYRQRIFVRDPRAAMEKSGVKQDEARVFINYADDVLVQDGGRWVLVQGWSGVAGVPERLSCLQGLVCMTASDHAGVTAVGTGVEMSSELVTFVDGDGAAVRVTLR